VDTKKKELVGDFKNGGRQWRPKGKPTRVRVHDFLIPEQGKAIPYGVYDLTRNATNCPQHVNPRAWRSANVRFTRP